VEHHDVVYALVHDGLDASIRDAVEEASQPLHGSPKIFSVEFTSDLLASLHLRSSQLPIIVSLKDHSMIPFHELSLSKTSTEESISSWLIANSLPTSLQLEAENFAKVMGPSPASSTSPKRLVILTALNSYDTKSIGLVQEMARKWHREHSDSPIQVVFAWMDNDKWASWLKSVYGIRMKDRPVVVVVDHAHLLYYDSMADGSPIPLDIESLKATFVGIESGALRAKYSENIAERFARRVNGWFAGIQSAVVNHPLLSIFVGALVAFGIVIGLKRLLEEDARRAQSSVYINSKSGGRLD